MYNKDKKYTYPISRPPINEVIGFLYTMIIDIIQIIFN